MTFRPSPCLPDHALRFIAAVLELHPQLAVFDCDGTLWSPDSGEQFFYWEIERGLLPEHVIPGARARYRDYKAGLVDEAAICGEMVTWHEGVAEELVARAARDFFDERVSRFIHPDMLELARRLHESGCDVWAISSTNEWVVRAGAARFGIGADRVIASCAHVENGCVTRTLLRVPTQEHKARAVKDLLPRVPDAAFGNSMHDFHMLEQARHAFAINPSPELEQEARKRQWIIYQPAVSS